MKQEEENNQRVCNGVGAYQAVAVVAWGVVCAPAAARTLGTPIAAVPAPIATIPSTSICKRYEILTPTSARAWLIVHGPSSAWWGVVVPGYRLPASTCSTVYRIW